MAAITIPGESLIARKQGNNEVLAIDKMVLAKIPGLNPDDPVDREQQMPPEDQIVLNEKISQFGSINPNLVVYSLLLSTGGESFDFNWLGLYASEDDVIVAITYLPTQSKDPSVAMTRNFTLEFSGATETTDIHIDAESWQVDYSARVNGMDERTRSITEDSFGRQLFYENTCKVIENGDRYYQVSSGEKAYLAGVEFSFEGRNILIDDLPTSVWLNVYRHGNSMSDIQPVVEIVISSDNLKDYVDEDGVQHFLSLIACINENHIIDKRTVHSQENERIYKSIESAKQGDNKLLDAIIISNLSNARFVKTTRDVLDETKHEDSWYYGSYPESCQFEDSTGQWWYIDPNAVLDVKWFGALGDGVTNDHKAFYDLGQFIYMVGSGNVSISKPKAFYGISNIKHENDNSFYGNKGFGFIGTRINGLTINFNNFPIRFLDGYKYGAFDKDTGVKIDKSNGDDTLATPGSLISLYNSTNLTIENMNFNGNNLNVDLGGTHGDTGWQIQSYGIRIRGDSRIVNINNCHVIYSPLDGMSLAIKTTIETDSSNIIVNNSSFLYCSRQACTIAGGTNHVLTNCKFNFSGQGGFRSAPAAGIDIEPEAGGAYGIKFINCESIGSKGVCLVCDLRGEVDRIVWDGGTLWGTDSHALWWAALGSLTIKNAKVYGQIRFLSKGLLENCELGDVEHSEYGIYRASRTAPLYDSLGGEFNNCTLYIYGQKWFGGNTPKLTNCKLIARLDGENEEITKALDGRLLASLGQIENVTLEDECIKGKFVNKPFIIIPYTTRWIDSLKGQGFSANLKGVIHMGSTTVPIDNNDEHMISGGCNNVSMEQWRKNLTWRYRNVPINNEEFSIGSLLFRTSSINSDLGIVCTTEGISGSTAVFKNFGGVR